MDNAYALLIDADNVSAKYIKPILDELSNYGNVTYKRIYGDWTSTHSSSWKSVLLAALTVFTAYVILFTNDLIFNTDYRIWVIDMRVFNVQKLLYFVAYFPAWVVFYLVNSLLVNGGNRVEGRPEWRTLLISCIGNIAGIAVLIFIQYHGIIANGTFAFNSMRIVNLFPLVFLIPVGTIVSRRFFKETGNIYAGSLVIAFLYCMMTVANTMCLGTIL